MQDRGALAVSGFLVHAFLSAFLAGEASAGAGLASGAAAPGTASIQGTWEGVYHVYPQIMKLTLELRSAGAQAEIVEGEARLRPLETDPRQSFEASLRIRGEYDPAAGSFKLEPGEWIQRPTQAGVRAPALQGVHDRRLDALAGTIDGAPPSGSPYFALARPGQAEKMLFGPAKAAASARAVSVAPGGILGRLERGLSGGPGAEGLLAWAKRLTGEYPDMDPYRTEQGALYLRARNLFADDHFKQHFGQTYDELGDRERTQILHTLQQRGSRNPDEALRQLGALSRAFGATGTYSVADITVSVLAQRILRSSRADVLVQLTGLQPAPDALDRIASLERLSEQQFATLWPSEREGVTREVEVMRSRLALPVLTASAEQALAVATGYDGARTLAAWPAGNAEPLGWLTPEERRDLVGRIEAGLDGLLEQLMADERARLPDLGEGLAAVEAGNRWLSGLSDRYAFAGDRAPVRNAMAALQSRRARDLAAARDAIAGKIAAQTDPSAVDRLVHSLLAIPGDTSTDAGTELLAAARARKATLDRQAYLAYFSPRERELMDDSSQLRVPMGYGPPTAEEMRLAVLRAFVDAGGRWIDLNTVSYGLSLLMGRFDYHVQVTGVNLACDPPTGSGSHECPAPTVAGYDADVRIHLKFAMSPEMRRFFDDARNMLMEGMLALANLESAVSEPAATKHLFTLTKDGWKTRTLTAELRLQNFSFLEGLLRR